MDRSIGITVASLILLAAASAFFSASETAYTCLNRVRLKNLANEGDEQAAKVLKLAENYDKLISSILIGNNIVNILSTSLATALFVRLLGSPGVTVSTVIMTVVVLLFGEVAPKSIARSMSERLAYRSYPLLHAVVILLTPLNALMGYWQRLVSHFIRTDEKTALTEEELITLVEEAETGGEIDENESQLIRSAIEFTDISVEDILTPRVDIVAIPENASPEVIAQRFAESGYSRLPVYRDGIDDIIGVLHEKDFYRNRGRSPLRTLLQRPLYTMPSTRLSVMLKRFQQNKAHMAVVMDEYDGVLGLVTLEDILEELVGEIWDEHDEIIEEYRQLPDGSYLVSGGASLDDLLDRFHLKGEYESVTVSGWVQEELGEFPKEGDSFTCEDLRVTVTKVDKLRIQEVRIEQMPEDTSERG